LVEIEKSKIMSYIEKIRLTKNITLSIREVAYLKDLFNSAKDTFDAPPRQETNLLQDDIITVTKQKNSKNHTELLNLLLGIYFDEAINVTEEKYYAVLKSK